MQTNAWLNNPYIVKKSLKIFFFFNILNDLEILSFFCFRRLCIVNIIQFNTHHSIIKNTTQRAANQTKCAKNITRKLFIGQIVAGAYFRTQLNWIGVGKEEVVQRFNKFFIDHATPSPKSLKIKVTMTSNTTPPLMILKRHVTLLNIIFAI